MLSFASILLLLRVVSCHATHLAIARTFSIYDAENLPLSFECWEEYIPCNGTTHSQVDLFLVFSQTLETSPVAQQAIKDVERKFRETNGWNSCINQIVGVGVGIDAANDIYRSKEQGSNAMWVNGPNRQFERTVRYIQNSDVANYECMYLMEMDSTPIRKYWLDALMLEIQDQTNEFTILGSKYRGDKWDSFLSELPTALLNHLNGNAVYNLTHPLLNLIVSELESEATTEGNTVPYDYRIAQMIEEGKTAMAPSFGNYDGVDSLPRKSTKFAAWTKMFSVDDAFKEGTVFGNYANTNMVPKYISEDEYIIHGANMFESWNESKIGDISLVVTAWNNTLPTALLSQLDNSYHPFKEILVMLPANAPAPEIPQTSTRTRLISRGSSPDFMDLCVAPVATRWFMITDSYHRLRRDLQLMIQEHQNAFKPVVSFSKPNHKTCFRYNSCIHDLSSARRIVPRIEKIFQTQDIVFHAARRSQYCRLWTNTYALDGTAPSATSYMAFLFAKHLTNDLYRLSFRETAGSRVAFLPLNRSWPKATSLHQRRLIAESNQTIPVNCTFLTTSEECLQAGCQWRSRFESCRSNNVVANNVQFQPQSARDSRPVWMTVVVWLGIGGGSFSILTLTVVGIRRSLMVDSVSMEPQTSDPVVEDDTLTDQVEEVEDQFEEVNLESDDEAGVDQLFDDRGVLGIRGHFEEWDATVEFVRDEVSHLAASCDDSLELLLRDAGRATDASEVSHHNDSCDDSLEIILRDVGKPEDTSLGANPMQEPSAAE